MQCSRILVTSCAFVLSVIAGSPASTYESCPLYPLGITSQKANNVETFYASSFVHPFREDEQAMIEARQEARISAHLLLQRDKRVPLGANGRLQGTVDEGWCIADGRMYFSVSINLKTAAQANELNQRLQRSLSTKPAPEIPSYLWVPDGNEKGEIKGIREMLKR